MTMQVEDNFIYNDKEYIPIAIEFPKKFLDFEKFKLKPIAMSTACWRGFVVTFAVKESRLVVDQILTNNQTYSENHGMETIVIHEINGVLPEVVEPNGLVEEYKEYRELHYKNLNYSLDYTGMVIIVKDFIREYISGPFAFLSISPFCYRKIIRLTFVKGLLTNTEDLSKYGKQIREERDKISKNENQNNAYFDWPDIDELFKKDI